MKAELQKFLSGLAKCANLTVEFPDNAPIRISGFNDGDEPFVLINADQPESELIFAILQKIGLVPVQNDNFWPEHFPWFLNRAYENEFAGEVAHKTRRTLRQMLPPERRADLWALYIYAQIPCDAQFVQFLKRHPEKKKFMPFVWYAILKTQVPDKFSTCIRILRSMFAAKFA